MHYKTMRRRRTLLGVVLGVVMAVAVAGVASAQTATTGSGNIGVPLGTGDTSTNATATAPTNAGGGSAAGGSATATGTAAAAGQGGLVKAPVAGFPSMNKGLIFPQGSVQFMPEYDSNDVLVIIDYQLPPGSKFPLNYQFRVPSGARLTGYALVDPSGSFDYNRPTPKVTPGKGWDLVDAQVPRDKPVHIEYYYNPGVNLKGERSFPLVYEAPAGIEKFAVSVQQPARSTGFTATPPLAQTTQDSQGLTYDSSELPGLKAGEQVATKVAYSKPDSNPTKASATETPETKASSNYLLWLLVAMVVGVAGFAAYRIISRRQAAPATAGGRGRGGSSAKAKGGGSSAKSKSGSSGTGPQRFCTNCGNKLTKNDRFCPECGQEREQ